MDPHAVLGLDPAASPEEVHRAYRDLAKRFHPDRAGDGEMMISINAAYDLLRDRLEEGYAEGPPRATTPAAAPGSAVKIAGAWLAPTVRRVLARELLAALEPDEQVDEVLLTSTGDSHDVQLALTDRRLLWLRDDAIMGRVRSLRYRDLVAVEQRAGGRFRRGAQLRVRSAGSGRWLRFFDLRPEVLARVAARISARAPS
ncbi:J domain-containing protein [Baekduia alba]|uniref:J domain-containing protein n=1 Tax=Baekduia alba TaxID=2997333 RepID=UPI00233FD350|nr:J domain-containing protein [Baekduia alba]